ncbi:MAG: hypothetical protein PVI91_10205 [Gammaproteobacteria bacterium]|jgi:hypothetical protein
MTKSTRTAIIVTAGYIVLAFWMLDFFADGFDWSNTAHHGVYFLPILILWGWWLYKKHRRP